LIVVDTNTVAYYLIQGERTAEAREVWRKDPDWIVPRLWRHEFLNILALYAQQDGLSVEQCREVWIRSQELLGNREHEPDMLGAFDIAVEHTISAYDAEFITLAKQHGVRCVTSDTALLRKFPEIALSMSDFVADAGNQKLTTN